MTWIALGFELTFVTVGFGLRTLVQRSRTGDSGWRLGRPWSVAALALGILGAQCQVRGVEEPSLRRTHGVTYERWAALAGRFVPWLGRTGAPAVSC
jgi:protein-S-isoprenylcysteine O-methyltransferase Ste14